MKWWIINWILVVQKWYYYFQIHFSWWKYLESEWFTQNRWIVKGARLLQLKATFFIDIRIIIAWMK